MLTGIGRRQVKGDKTEEKGDNYQKQCSWVDEQRWESQVHRWKAGIKEKIRVSPLMAVRGGVLGGEADGTQMLWTWETGTCIINEEGKSSAESKE